MTDPLSVCDYTHLNPVRAKLIVEEEKLETYSWSSYPDYLKAPRERPEWLRTDRLLGEHGITRQRGRSFILTHLMVEGMVIECRER